MTAPTRERAPEIECDKVSCELAATRGGIVVVQPNGLTPTHAIYYACDGDRAILSGALETWPIAHRDEQPGGES